MQRSLGCAQGDIMSLWPVVVVRNLDNCHPSLGMPVKAIEVATHAISFLFWNCFFYLLGFIVNVISLGDHTLWCRCKSSTYTNINFHKTLSPYHESLQKENEFWNWHFENSARADFTTEIQQQSINRYSIVYRISAPPTFSTFSSWWRSRRSCGPFSLATVLCVARPISSVDHRI